MIIISYKFVVQAEYLIVCFGKEKLDGIPNL